MRRYDTTEGDWADQQIPVAAADVPGRDDTGAPGNAAVRGDVAVPGDAALPGGAAGSGDVVPDYAAWSAGPATNPATGAGAAAPEFAIEANPADVAEQQLTVPTDPPYRG